MLSIITLPFIGSLLIALFGKRELIRNLTTVIISIILLITLIFISNTGINDNIGIPIIIPHLGLLFSWSNEGVIFAFMISFLWILANIYAIGYMRFAHDSHQQSFFFFFTTSIAFTLGIAFSGNLLTMFVFYELLTISTYPLIVNRATEDAIRAGNTYLRFLLGSSLLLLFPAIAVTYYFLGNGDFSSATNLPSATSDIICSVLLAMFVYGAGKAALMPMHKWLLAAMVAETPVSALLHAVAVVKAGAFVIIKTNFYIFGIEWVRNQHWLILIASFTIIMSSVYALRATHLKTRLAYSTVSQLSYVILLATISEDIILPVIYMVFHAFAKITLFFVAGAISTQANTQKISELDGIGKSMPWTMVCFAISAFSMIGLPFTGLFGGKMLLLTSAASSYMHLFIVAMVTLSTLLNTLYFFPIVYHSFFSKEIHKCNEVGLIMRLPMIITTLCNISAFWFFVRYQQF